MSCAAGDSVSSNYPPVGALLLQSGPTGNNAATGLKGRLNFLAPSDLPATHLITLGDSNPAKTLATPGHRPTNDATDTWIGLDNLNAAPSLFQLAFGAPVSISSYIGNIGDGTNWLERLQTDPILKTSLKSFQVPITTNSQIISTLPTSSTLAPFTVLSTVPVSTLVVSNHPQMQYCGTTTTCSHTSIADGQMVFGTISFPTGMTSVTLSGINPAFQTNNVNCVANDLTSPGRGVNAVPQTGGSSVLFTGVSGSGGDTISYQCVGR